MQDQDQTDSEMFTHEVFPALPEERRLQMEISVTRLLHFQRRLGTALVYGTIAAVATTAAFILWK